MKQRFLSLLCAMALILSLVPAASAAKSKLAFSDVPKGEWFYPYITELAEDGRTSGYEDGTFRPNGEITLAEVLILGLASLPGDELIKEDAYAQALAKAEQTNGNYWANSYIAKAQALEITDFGWDKARWGKPATREEIAYILAWLYSRHQYAIGKDGTLGYYTGAYHLIGDYFTQVVGSPYEPAILWLYSSGIISGMNGNGDFMPKSTTTRAQSCTMLLALLHPERWEEVDWDQVAAEIEAEDNMAAKRLTDGKDFTGKARMRYDLDVAYDFCRELEREIGIQVFYLPEWTEKEAGLLQHDSFDRIPLTKGYFLRVMGQLQAMKAAYDQYPDGFLKEMAQKKNKRTAEIILCPDAFGGGYHGEHVYDYSDDAKKVDQIYYTGMGDPYFYHHEMGHMVMSCAAILNGWNATCSHWEELMMSSDAYGFVSNYSTYSRPEDWAETWAYLWYYTDRVKEQCALSPSLTAKVQYMTSILDKQYSKFSAKKPLGQRAVKFVPYVPAPRVK